MADTTQADTEGLVERLKGDFMVDPKDAKSAANTIEALQAEVERLRKDLISPLRDAEQWLVEALKAEGYKPSGLQWEWRTEPEKFDARLMELAVCDALIDQGFIAAHPGDGVSCAAQMIEAQAQRAGQLQETFDLRWDADMRAIKRWQAETGKTLTWPDHADLCVWLLEERDTAEAALAEMRGTLENVLQVFGDEGGESAEQMIADIKDTLSSTDAGTGLLEALKWYADERNWENKVGKYPPLTSWGALDLGRRARAALAGKDGT